MKRAILPILVVMSLLIVPAISGMRSEETTKSGDNEIVKIMIGKDDDGLNIADITTTKTEAEEFLNSIQNFRSWIETTRPFQDRELSPEEINAIKEQVNDLIGSLNTLLEANGGNPISPQWVCRELFETEIGRSTILSVGIGYAFIPFYDYETFLGIMIRPIWLFYPPLIFGGGGYTGNLNLNVFPPRIEYGDRIGCHIVRTTVFSGLYINIGDLGYNNKVLGGPMILLGQARVVMH